MAPDNLDPSMTTLDPDEAFSVLGNETRMAIVQTLGAADEPLSFSRLRDAVGMEDSGQFNYHLDHLTGHFIRKDDDGYSLRQAGLRVREAVLSGAVTEDVVIESTPIAPGCPYCGGHVEMSFREERLRLRCRECVGAYSQRRATSRAFGRLPKGTITLLYVPSAAVVERSDLNLLEVAHAWTYTEYVSMANGICPRCTGTVETSVEVCSKHHPGEGLCSQCHARFGVFGTNACTICNHTKRGTFVHHLFGKPAYRSFYELRDIDPLAPAWEDLPALYNFDETVLQNDPFACRYGFTVAGDHIEITVDHHFEVVETHP